MFHPFRGPCVQRALSSHSLEYVCASGADYLGGEGAKLGDNTRVITVQLCNNIVDGGQLYGQD